MINKPINFAVQGGNKVKHSIDKIINLESTKTGICYCLTHRLDKDSSGILIWQNQKK